MKLSEVTEMRPHKPASASSRLRPIASIVVLGLGLALSPVFAAAGSPSVGKISFAIGAATVTDSTGRVRTAEAGTEIAVGDRIETPAGAHAHIRFIDQGLVSVRPGSVLVVEQYTTSGDDISIRFRLENGVVRSITGEAAKVHKDRFRLNTPLAAIGVRGTDFVVKTDSGSLQAMVNEGAIVVASLGGNCVAQGLGPCSGTNAFELSDAMGRVLLEMSTAQAPRITSRMPQSGQPAQDVPAGAAQEPGARNQLVVVAEVTTIETKRRLPEQTTPQPLPEPAPPPEVVVTPPPPQVVVTPPLPTEPPALQWGRRAGPALAGETLSTTYEEASNGRSLIVANKYVGLFREAGSSPVLSTQLGQGNFALSGGGASLIQPNGSITGGAVNGGWLRIDFAQRNFATELSLAHPQTGAVLLGATGKVRDDGVFFSTADGTRVAGAVSFNGKEAGYLFDKTVPLGTLTGTTLWKR